MPIIRKTIYLALFAAILALSSCHSTKVTSPSADAYPKSRSVLSDKKVLSEEFTTLAETYYTWTDVQAPVKILIIQPKPASLSGVAKMIKGENIHVSIRVFGFEVGSLYADKDIVQIYIKAMDMYWAEPLSTLTDRYGLTLTDMQSLLLGQPFVPGKGVLTSAETAGFTIEGSDGTIIFSPKEMPEDITWAYTAVVNPESSPYLSAMTLSHDAIGTVNCTFAEPTISPAGAVSPMLECGIKLGDREAMGSWKWSFESSKWNSGLKVSRPNISKSARKVETSQLIKMLKSL